MSGPGPNKIPMNIYLTRQHKANLKADARRLKIPMTQVVHNLLDAHQRTVKKHNGGKLPKPMGIYKAPWVVKQRAKRKTKSTGISVRKFKAKAKRKVSRKTARDRLTEASSVHRMRKARKAKTKGKIVHLTKVPYNSAPPPA